jgi:hypothetical protein
MCVNPDLSRSPSRLTRVARVTARKYRTPSVSHHLDRDGLLYTIVMIPQATVHRVVRIRIL